MYSSLNRHTQINPFFYFLFILLFIIYIAIIYFVFIRISHFSFSLCRQCNSLGRMIFMCAYLPAASSRSVANPALPPQKKELSERGRLKSRPREILVLTYVGNRIFNELWQLGRVVKAKD
ncbi:CFF_HP2_G0012490.mRNA.1.CDS.1 [Saccharomyces cerevisiae]|nr:CFF_HP2_G0012490.mRNA.1.CDS.1 [Saccharomyces cerevisiae]CAI6531723.1 CFF_HP2_G0012490.mRNA.1.CDS.1 [Saccharomyces cerevisiae]